MEWQSGPEVQLGDSDKRYLHSSSLVGAGSSTELETPSSPFLLTGGDSSPSGFSDGSNKSSISSWSGSSKTPQIQDDSVSLSEIDIIKEALPKELRDSILDDSVDIGSSVPEIPRRGGRYSIGSTASSRKGEPDRKPGAEAEATSSSEFLELVLHVPSICGTTTDSKAICKLKFIIIGKARIWSPSSLALPILRLKGSSSIPSHHMTVSLSGSNGGAIKISRLPSNSTAEGPNGYRVVNVASAQAAFQDPSRNNEACFFDFTATPSEPVSAPAETSVQSLSPGQEGTPRGLNMSLPSLGGVGEHSLTRGLLFSPQTAAPQFNHTTPAPALQLISVNSDPSASAAVIGFSSVKIYQSHGDGTVVSKLRAKWPCLLETLKVDQEQVGLKLLSHFNFSLAGTSILGVEVVGRMLPLSTISTQGDEVSISFPPSLLRNIDEAPSVEVLFSTSQTSTAGSNLALPVFPSLVHHLEVEVGELQNCYL